MRLEPLRNELQIDLREQGVAAVTCTYSGSDDEGFLNRPRLYTAAGQLFLRTRYENALALLGVAA